jgi:hypothetical protein
LITGRWTRCRKSVSDAGLLALTSLFKGGDAPPLLVPIAFYIVSNLSAVYSAPVPLALFAREAPPGRAA